MNTVNIIGRLTRDAELSYTNTQTAICKFSIAYSKKFKGEEKSHFFDCVMFGKFAEALNQYLTKGTQVGITAELEQQRWEQDGNKRSKVSLNVRDLTLLGKGGKSQGEPSASSHGNSGNDQDIPF